MAISARIDELRKKFEENPRRYFAPLANEYRKAGDPGQAIAICEKHLPQQPGHMSGHIVFGQALYEVNRLDEARAVFETALSLDPENLIALRHLGDIARQTGNAESARGWYHRVLEADPRNEEITQILASLPTTSAPTPPQALRRVQPWARATPAQPTTPIIEAAEPPELQARTPRDLAAQGIASLERFDAAITPAEPTLPPPIVPAPSLAPPPQSGDQAPLDEVGSHAGLRLSGPIARVGEDTPAAHPPFAHEESPLTAHTIDIDRVEGLESVHASFEADSLAITAQPDLPPPLPVGTHEQLSEAATTQSENAQADDAGLLEGAFIDESAFEPFSLGTPVPPEPNFNFVHQAKTASAEIVSASHDEPPPLPFVEMTVGEAITAETARAETGSDEAIDDELASFLARHTDHHKIPTDLKPASAMPELASFEIAETFGNIEAAHAPDAAHLAEPADESGSTHEASDQLEGVRESADDADQKAPEPDATLVAEVMEVTDVTDATDVTPVMNQAVADTAAPVAQEVAPVPEPTPREEALASELVEQPSESPAVLETPASETGVEAPPQPVESETLPVGADSIDSVIAAAESHPVDASAAVAVEEPGATKAPKDQEAAREREATIEHEAAGEETAETPPPVPTDAFATETMAELYLQQGHLEPALDIYKKLVDQHPGDPQLRERLGVIERRMFGTPPASHPAVDVEGAAPIESEAPAPAPAGPTIREFLALFATRSRVVADDSATADAGSSTAEQGAFEVADHPVVETSRGSIDALFSGADSSADDAMAATALSEAFAPDDDRTVPPLFDLESHSPPIAEGGHAGTPASETANTDPNDDGFSFDQFFAADVQSSAPPAGRETESAPGDSDDVAQFNHWLSGLKKPS